MPSRRRFRTETEAADYLLGFVNYEAKTHYRPTTHSHDLRRFERDLRALGWRPREVRTVHVGGTNGKGTVCTLLESILRAGGLRTGLYTSPHVLSWRERIRIAGRPLSSRAFCQGVERLAEAKWPRGEGFRTTFEHLTALALLAFQEATIDVAVIEVGLGGKLDATNVLPPGRAVLTPISLDHQGILGRKVARIAADKARILKRGGRAFLMPQDREAMAPILRRCHAEGLSPIRCSEAVVVRATTWNGSHTWFEVLGREDYGRIRTRLLGAHQEANLAAAVAVAETLLPRRVLRQAVRVGLRDAGVRGRLEGGRFRGVPLLIDGGHNPAAAKAIARALARHYPGARIAAVVGMALDKDHRRFFQALAPFISSWHLTPLPSPRGAQADLLRRRLPRTGRTYPDPESALRGAARDLPDLILVTGSFVLAGAVLARAAAEAGKKKPGGSPRRGSSQI